jgi:hypothetical protein
MRPIHCSSHAGGLGCGARRSVVLGYDGVRGGVASTCVEAWQLFQTLNNESCRALLETPLALKVTAVSQGDEWGISQRGGGTARRVRSSETIQ